MSAQCRAETSKDFLSMEIQCEPWLRLETVPPRHGAKPFAVSSARLGWDSLFATSWAV